VARVGGDLLGGVDDTVDNIYLFNLMLSLDQSQRDPTRLAHLTLPHFLDRLTTDDGSHWFYDETAEGMTRGQDEGTTAGDSNPQFAIRNPQLSTNYVLIIDQFEEILTTHGDRWPDRADFFRQLEAAMVADPALWVVTDAARGLCRRPRPLCSAAQRQPARPLLHAAHGHRRGQSGH
jgi:hypothetical protein